MSFHRDPATPHSEKSARAGAERISAGHTDAEPGSAEPTSAETSDSGRVHAERDATTRHTPTSEHDTLRPHSHTLRSSQDHIPLEAHVINALTLPHSLPILRELLGRQRSIIPLDQPHPSPNIPALMRAGNLVEPGMIIASTSGSTGIPKGAILTHENLLASIKATQHYARTELNEEPGPWLLALPAHHIAGLQVILRSLYAGYEPSVSTHMLEGTSFQAEQFIADSRAFRERYPELPLYVSLVPTQLDRIMAHPQGQEALNLYAMVLVGGAAARAEVVEEARARGAQVVITYGSAETAGGAVYNRRALEGVTISIESPDASGVGRVVISGAMVSPGYRNVAGGRAFPSAGTFVTSDLGKIDEDGSLKILGRADGAINTGGYKVLPEEVERVLWHAFPHAENVCAIRLDDEEFGESVGAALELPELIESLPPAEVGRTPRGRAYVDITKMVRDSLRGTADRHVIPSRSIALDSMPTVGPGKVDRLAIEQAMNMMSGW